MRRTLRRFHLQPCSNCGTSNFVISCLLAIFAAQTVSCQNQCSNGPCYPSPTDIAGKFNVTANSTCGDPSPEQYCLNLVCDNVCNANDDSLKHPPSFVNDAFSANTFWKSKNYEFPVVLHLDVGSTFMLYQSVVTFYHDLPAAMYFLKSNDSGLTYRPITYFATNCTQYFNMPETPDNERDGLKVQCFKIDPGTNPSKQLYYSPMRDEAAAQNLLTDPEKQAFFLMTNLRMVLVKFITPSQFNPSTITTSLKRSFFFTVSDWDVLAACFCNGQASQCDPNDISKCICKRNTDGRNCERCLPLFNNKPYRIREACEACECNNHADSCTYNKTKGYGVCDNCKDNTQGDHCDLCKRSFYRNQAVPQNDSNTCLACACHVPGVNSSADSSTCDGVTGQCACKSNVTGRACDTCRDTFWKLSTSNEAGCEDCKCNLTGTVNESNVCDKVSGQCPCKPLLTGRTCNKCQVGYYGLTSQNPGCTACNCDMAGSVNSSCSSSGQCYCRPRFSGDRCNVIEQGFFVPSVDFMTFQAEDALAVNPTEKRINHTTITNTAGDSVLVVGVILNEGTSGPSPTVLQFTVNVPKTGFFNFVLRYKTSFNWQLIRINALLRTAFVPFSCNNGTQVVSNEPYFLRGSLSPVREAHDFGKQCFLAGQYQANLTIPFESAQPAVNVLRRRRALPDADIVVDSVVVMPTVSEYDAFQEASPAVQENMTFYYNSSFSLRTWSAHSEAGSAALSPVFGEIFGEGQSCNCSTVGSNNPQQCERNGGQCSCKPHVIGRTCDACRPDYFNFTSRQGCTACNCNDIGANASSCHPESGQCSCRENVIGLQCSSCRENFYNFNSRAGCLPCNCHEMYSSNLQCDDNSGRCSCKAGVNGGKCTGCSDQFYNLTEQGCRACECNLSGSMMPVCNITTGQCPCKVNSLGLKCDTCPAGFYGLDANHSEGCLECMCSNKTTHCMADPGWFISRVTTELSVRINNVLVDGWTGINSAGSSVQPVLDWDIPIMQFEKGSMKIDTAGSQDVYFVAPAKYLGDKRFAYTLTLSFQLQQDNASLPASSSEGDVVLEGKWFPQPLVTSLRPPPPSGNRFQKYQVRLVESAWRVGNTSGRQPTNHEMVRVLSHLTSLRIRAKWTSLTVKLYSRLGDIALEVSNRTSVIANPQNASNVERCTCPPEYKGQFCEQCADGYTRSTPNGGPYETCVRCQCNNHSNTCHPETGVCIDCSHNTTGDHCEKCYDGWYGNATNATPQDCKPCPCPGGPRARNQFANTCALSSDGLPTCVNCSQGHQGRYCESCMEGYFGRPREEDGQCRKCGCNNNSGSCNTTTGECLNCLHNTTGFNCEWCAPEFYGSALNKTCTRCNCSSVGAVSNVCNNMTGDCFCQPYVTGKLCGRCEQNAFNYTPSGCMPCNCDADGSTDLQCDAMYGNCSCKTNVIGSKCDMCSAGYFDVTQSCLDCNCTVNQTVANTTCNPVSGQCECRVSLAGGQYGGRQCETCGEHTVGSPPSCHPCTEPCYLNWEILIRKENEKVDQLSGNVTQLLESFGSMSVDGINSTLQMLKANVTYANQIFSSGGRADLVKKREQINRIQSSIDSFQLQLNNSLRSIEDAQRYLTEHVANFNGSVRITPAIPLTYPSFPVVCPSGGGVSVIVDWKCIEAMALSYRQRALRANESGHANYTSIRSSYSVIQQANSTAYLAARQISESLSQLNMVTALRETIESRLGDEFQNLYRNNSLQLEEMGRINRILEELVSQAEEFGEKANKNLTKAMDTATQAKNESGQRRREAQSARESAVNAHSDAVQVNREAENALNAAMEFKENATRVLNFTKDAVSNVTAGINTVARVSNMTKEAVRISDEVRALNMPVSLHQIQNLTEDILNTNVSQEMVNQTLKSAQQGLKQARQVEALSQEAITVAQQTLNQVQEIETAINSSEHIRQEVISLQQQTDTKIADINNVTQTVQDRFSASYSSGQSLLTKINDTLSNMDDGLKCFDNAKTDAKNASHTAELAFNISENAKEMFDNSSVSLPPVEARVNSSYDAANRNLSEIQQTHQDSEQLLQDVTEAEELLQQYIAQRDELERLGREIRDMDREADELLAQFSVAADQYGQCAGAA